MELGQPAILETRRAEGGGAYTKRASACCGSPSTRRSQVGQYHRASIGVPHAGWRGVSATRRCSLVTAVAGEPGQGEYLPPLRSSHADGGSTSYGVWLPCLLPLGWCSTIVSEEGKNTLSWPSLQRTRY